MHPDHFPPPIHDTSPSQHAQPLFFLDYLPSFLDKTSWQK